jgi:hypothetical protein
MNPSGTTWRTWREAAAVVLAPRSVMRTGSLALLVGTLFFTMNQLGAIVAGSADTIVWLKAAMTYLTPLVVSNLGILSATRQAVGPVAGTGASHRIT